jgi:hypothetical protein
MGLLMASQIDADADATNWWRTLPFAYEDVCVSTGSRPVGFRFSQSIINIEARLYGQQINACGEGASGDLAMTKAIAELIERSAMMTWLKENPSAPIASSNGWAAHQTFEEARSNAVFERVERDAVLAQWYSSTPFLEIGSDSLPARLRGWAANELSLSEFPIFKILLSTEGLGPSVTCLFLNTDGFGVSGNSAKSDLTEAIEGAISEACRAAHHTIRRSFWADSVRLKENDRLSRTAPGGHAVYYAYHEPFPKWMFGPEITWSKALDLWISRTNAFQCDEFGEFSFQTALEAPLHVGFAAHASCFEIAWGPTNAKFVLEKAANRKFTAPLTERTLNLQPHIVS